MTQKQKLWIGFYIAVILFVGLAVATGHQFYETMLFQSAPTSVSQRVMMSDQAMLLALLAGSLIVLEIASILLRRIRKGPDHLFIELHRD